jgi:hypothetical protein
MNEGMKAEAAEQRLHQFTLASTMVSEVMAQSEHFPAWQDELMEMSWQETVAEYQYRIVNSPETWEVYIVEVKSIDQDDNDEPYANSISHQSYAEWLWSTLDSDEQESHLSAYLKHLSSAGMCEVAVFQWASPADRDYLFGATEQHPSDCIWMADYLKANWKDWHRTCNLVDEGDDVELTQHEVYEHWIVDDYTKSQLESVGEKVVSLFDFEIWCRCATGQSLYYDSALQQLGEQYLAEAKD